MIIYLNKAELTVNKRIKKAKAKREREEVETCVLAVLSFFVWPFVL